MMDTTVLPPRRASRLGIVATSVLGVVAAGSTATALALALHGPAQPAAPQAQVFHVQSAPVPAVPSHVQPAPAPAVPSHVTPAAPSGGHRHVVPTPPAPPTPSAAIETLQRELGQLNYYEGPVTGYLNADTTAAIRYLQRDAHLPQTGKVDSATAQALQNFLEHGNNQMGS